MIHIYKGDGKGKTTAAIGLCIRACGADSTVGWLSFLKDGMSSEITILKSLNNITVFPCVNPLLFSWNMTAQQKQEITAFYQQQCRRICEVLPKYDLIVLDEILDALYLGFLTKEQVLKMIDYANDHCTELVLTGHETTADILDKADYITQMNSQKHPFENGTQARKGIEY